MDLFILFHDYLHPMDYLLISSLTSSITYRRYPVTQTQRDTWTVRQFFHTVAFPQLPTIIPTSRQKQIGFIVAFNYALLKSVFDVDRALFRHKLPQGFLLDYISTYLSLPLY